MVILVMLLSAKAQAQNLVQNGDFTQTNAVGVQSSGVSSNGGQLLYDINAVGWSNTLSGSTPGYNFLFTTNSFSNTNGVAGNAGNLNLWSTNYAGGGGTLSSPPTNAYFPTPGNFIANDGAYLTTAVQQTVTNLIPGQSYVLNFYWAAGQQQRNTFSNSITAQWFASLGGTTNATSIYTNAPQSVSPWMQSTAVFAATNSTEVLSFLASGTPNGQPPFSLLGGVSLVAVPEPSQVASSILLLVGVTGFLVYRKRRGTAATVTE